MKILLLFLSFIFCINLNAQKGKYFQSGWHESENGETNVHSDNYNFFKKGKLYYFLSNDNSNIYIDMNIEDTGVQNRILKQGLTIWVNMDGKSAKKMGVRYPIVSQYSGNRNKTIQPDETKNQEGSGGNHLSLANTIELIGFTNEETRRFPSDNTDNFRGSVKYDNKGILIYRLIMPLSKLPVRNSRDGMEAMPFALGIEYGAAPSMNDQRGAAGPPQSTGSSSGIPRGGSRGGGMPRGGGQAGRQGAGQMTNQSSTPSVILWVKNIKLATDR
jgi:hypothetical protein